MGLVEAIKALSLPSERRQQMQYMKMLSGYTPVFSQFGSDIYASDVVQMCIDAIATECSKLRPRHIRTDSEGMQVNVNDDLNRLFRISPNPLMTTRDFIEKIIWSLYLNYNAWVFPAYTTRTDAGGNTIYSYTGLYPLNPTDVTFLQDGSERIFVEMRFANGEKYGPIPYSDLIHLRKKFSLNDVMGGGRDGMPDNRALLKVLSTDDVVLQGLEKAIKTSMSIRGVMKYNMMLNDEAMKAERERFETAVMAGKTSIMQMDTKGEFNSITLDPKVIDKDVMDFIQRRILNWFGVSVPILNGDFTDEQYQAFYEKTLEPLIISLGQAFSKALFTARELAAGNEIVFYPQALLYANIKNKTGVADILGARGALTNNALLELFGYPPYEGGGVRYVSLNYIDSTLANEYQMKRAGLRENGGDPNGNGQNQNQSK